MMEAGQYGATLDLSMLADAMLVAAGMVSLYVMARWGLPERRRVRVRARRFR